MQARRKLLLGRKGTKNLRDRCGASLVCVRYRYDIESQRRFATAKLIGEDAPWSPPVRMPAEAMIGVRLIFHGVELKHQVKRARGKWNPERHFWKMQYDQEVAAELRDRIEGMKVSTYRHLVGGRIHVRRREK